MAQIVGGIGMAHSSLVVAPEPEMWAAHNRIDRENPHLRTKAGAPATYAELEQLQGTHYIEESQPERLNGQIRQTVAAVTRLREDLARLRPDVLIVFGDDQEEMHTPDNHPTLAIFEGSTFTMGTSLRFVTYEQVLGDATPMMKGYAMDARHEFPGIATAAACKDLPFVWDEYIPVYRTPAGTGIGLAFSLWSADGAES